MSTLQFKLNENYIYSYKNFDIISTNHSETRAISRNKLSPEELEQFYQNIIDKLIELGYHEEIGSEYLFYSDSLKQGVVIGITKDNYKANKPAIFIVTFLPRGKSTPKSGTEKVIVEKYSEEQESYISQNFIDYILTISNLNESDSKVKLNDNIELKFYIYEGKIWDCNYEIIEV